MKKRVLGMLCIASLMLGACGADTTESEVVEDVQKESSILKDSVQKVPNLKLEKGIYGYGGKEFDEFKGVTILSKEKAYVAVGSTKSYDIEGLEKMGGKVGLIVKFDKENNMLWQKAYSQDCTFMDVELTEDGGYVAVGYKDLKPQTFIGIIVKYDKDGNVVWEKEYGTAGQICFNELVATEDDGVVVAGYIAGNSISELSINGHRDGLLVKFDADGNVVWQQNYGGTKRDEFYSVAIREDGGLVVAGIMYSVDAEGITNFSPDEDDNADAIIVNYDADGKMLSQKNYGGNDTDGFHDVVVTKEGDIVAAGYAYSKDIEGIESEADYIGYLVCMDEAGTIKWQKGYGHTGWNGFRTLTIAKNGDYYVAGYAMGLENAPTPTAMNGIVLRYDDEGTLLEETPYFARTDTDLNDIVAVRDGYMVVGECYDSLEGFEFSCGSGECLRIIE